MKNKNNGCGDDIHLSCFEDLRLSGNLSLECTLYTYDMECLAVSWLVEAMRRARLLQIEEYLRMM